MAARSLRHRITTMLLAALVAVGVVAVVPQSSVAAPPGDVTFVSADGLTVDAATQDGPRLWRLTVSTASLSRAVHVNVLLPTGYEPSARRYPTLYLFHGTSGTADDWIKYGNVVAATATYPMIVVMPDAGYDGNGGSWFTNWDDQNTKLGAANWEDFHIGQLIPWIDDNLATIASRDGRAVAGLSQGGFGSFSYAARHPDTFASAASFSGAPDIDSNLLVKAGATTIIEGTASGLDGVQPEAMFGSPIFDDINWQGHNPGTLVTNLADTQLRLWSGNGLPGPLDPNLLLALGGAPIEAVAHVSTLSFAQLATKAHVPYVLTDYGAGTHTFPYWARDLVQYLPEVTQLFTHPAGTPAAVSYRSIDATWRQWGWTVANHRSAPRAFSALTDASALGFTFSGTAATVTTPAVYTPGSRHAVSVTGGTAPSSALADGTGRLTIDVAAASAKTAARISISAEQAGG